MFARLDGARRAIRLDSRQPSSTAGAHAVDRLAVVLAIQASPREQMIQQQHDRRQIGRHPAD